MQLSMIIRMSRFGHLINAWPWRIAGTAVLLSVLCGRLSAQEPNLVEYDTTIIAAQARLRGDPKRGALVFHKSAAACVKCHATGDADSPLGPDLAKVGPNVTDQHIVDSILRPSAAISKGYELVTVLMDDGLVKSGMIAADASDYLLLRDLKNLEVELKILKNEIEEMRISQQSIMPDGLATTLQSERDLFDLVRYLTEIASGGPSRAATLQPDPSELAIKDDTIDLDHAGIVRSLNEQDFKAGKSIYLGHCKNCHGSDGNTPSLPAARAFGTEPLKFGSDPFKMHRTLTLGAGLMTGMQHLSPKERYQVIHYIRKGIMKPGNPDYHAVDDDYLNSLPTGTAGGEFDLPNVVRDFGPALGSQLGAAVNNALCFRLAGDVTVCYDLHRMKLAGVWTGGFLNLSQTHHYRQRGEQMPQIDGELIPGLSDWYWSFDGGFDIPVDAKPPRGPLRNDWLQYYGHYLFDDQAILSFGIHHRRILEAVHSSQSLGQVVLHHTLRIEAGNQPLRLCVARLDGGGKAVELTGLDSARMIVRQGSSSEPSRVVGAMVTGDSVNVTWSFDEIGRLVLSIPPDDEPRVLGVLRGSTSNRPPEVLCESLRAAEDELVDPLTMTRGGPLRWPTGIVVKGKLGEPINGYALDTIPVPFENQWNAWLRTSALDFFDDGRAVVTTHGGDVYILHGIDGGLEYVTWKRFAAGLFEPFGVRVIEGKIYVTCRDGIKRLHDFNDDGEADFVEAFWIDDDVSNIFHAYNFDLQTDSQGNFYFAKAGQYTQHHRPGSIMRIPPDGGRADVVAWGLRTPNGMGKLKDDRFTVSDNQGPWMPAGKISLIKPGSFLGSMPITDEQDAWLKQKHGDKLPKIFDEPVIWMPQELDSSCGGQVWVDDPRFGPLSGRLLHSSFGKGWVYYLSLQEMEDTMQGAMVALPHQWDAGVMRLRVNPADGQLYGTGLSGWQGPADGKDGCLQRLRYTGESIKMIDDLQVVPQGIELSFNFDLDPKTAGDPRSWRCQIWDYLWSEQYGSDDYSVLRPDSKGRDVIAIQHVQLISDRRVRLQIPELQVCDQLLLEMNFSAANGQVYIEQIYATVHKLPAE